MSLTLSIFILLAGILLLYFGASFLVKGSANIARILGVKPLIVGLTIVAFGTSMPEFMVSVFGVLKGVSDISVGNIIGSNIANIGLILGTAGLITPIAVNFKHIGKQLIILLAASIIFCVVAYNGITQFEGWIFILFIILYVIYLIRSPKADKNLEDIPEADNSIIRNILYTIAGIILLVLASRDD
jgi:cation:H+ antiporter